VSRDITLKNAEMLKHSVITIYFMTSAPVIAFRTVPLTSSSPGPGLSPY